MKGETSFHHVVSNSGYSGFRKRRYDRPYEYVREITVEADLLDNIIPRTLPIHLIKIDVEGAELQVFKGAIRTIYRNKPIVIFEHGIGGADCYGTTPEDVYDLLTKECKLHISLMKDWLSNKHTLSRQEFVDQFYQHMNYYFMTHS